MQISYSTSGDSGSYVRTINSVNLTNFTKLKITYTIVNAASKDVWSSLWVDLPASSPDNAIQTSCTYMSSNTGITTYTDTVNISSISGNRYIKLNNFNSTIRITKVWLE